MDRWMPRPVLCQSKKLEKLENDFENCTLINNALKEDNFEMTIANSTCKIELNALKEDNFELTIANSTCKIELNDLKHANKQKTKANQQQTKLNGQQAKQIRGHEILITVLAPVEFLIIVALVAYIIYPRSLNKLSKTKKRVIEPLAASGGVSNVTHEMPGNGTEMKRLLPPEGQNGQNADGNIGGGS